MDLAVFSFHKMFDCEGNEKSRDTCFEGGIGGMLQLDSVDNLAGRNNLNRWERRRIT